MKSVNVNFCNLQQKKAQKRERKILIFFIYTEAGIYIVQNSMVGGGGEAAGEKWKIKI